VGKKFGCRSVDNNWEWFNVQVERGSTSGIITDDSATLGLDNLVFEVVGGTFGPADRSCVS
jgi:hypothetical protein